MLGINSGEKVIVLDAFAGYLEILSRQKAAL